MRQPLELLGFLFPNRLARQAVAHARHIALAPDEWSALFGAAASPLRDGGVAALVAGDEFAAALAPLGDALRCSLTESEPAAAWARPHARATAFAGMHLEDAEDAVSRAIGSVVRADSRRLEELVVRIDEAGPETLLLARVVAALVASVV